MLAVILYGLEIVYGFRERRMCRSAFSGTISLETERSCSFFVFGHWGMFAALAYGDVRLGLKYRVMDVVTRNSLDESSFILQDELTRVFVLTLVCQNP